MDRKLDRELWNELCAELDDLMYDINNKLSELHEDEVDYFVPELVYALTYVEEFTSEGTEYVETGIEVSDEALSDFVSMASYNGDIGYDSTKYSMLRVLYKSFPFCLEVEMTGDSIEISNVMDPSDIKMANFECDSHIGPIGDIFCGNPDLLRMVYTNAFWRAGDTRPIEEIKDTENKCYFLRAGSTDDNAVDIAKWDILDLKVRMVKENIFDADGNYSCTEYAVPIDSKHPVLLRVL